MKCYSRLTRSMFVLMQTIEASPCNVDAHQSFAYMIKEVCGRFPSFGKRNAIQQGDVVQAMLGILHPCAMASLRDNEMGYGWHASEYKAAADHLQMCLINASQITSPQIHLISDAYYECPLMSSSLERREENDFAGMMKSMMQLHLIAFGHLTVTQFCSWNDQALMLAELDRLPHAFRQLLLDAGRDDAWIKLMSGIIHRLMNGETI